jgi:cellulose synthase/poly-beta-1,6-N-acetylglucosamine synthase-like glycosyltransferase
MLWLEVLFWCSLAGLAYIYAGYPLAVWMAGQLTSRPRRGDAWSGEVSVVLVGYNEAARLPGKLRSILASGASERILEILVGSDGSEDGVADVVAAVDDPRVRLIHFNMRRGKPAVLNDIVPQCRAEVVVLTDARQLLEPSAIARLTGPFADPSIGVVSGELMFRESQDDSAAAVGMGAYWKYEKLIRRSESDFRSVPGATGAFYAIRRDLFRAVPDNTLLDDVVIPMQAVESGYRCILESGAVAWDTPSQSARQEAVRKRRTIAGCAQLILNQPRWLLPWRNPIWWEYMSHKLARLLSPLLLAALLASNLALASLPAYRVLLILQGVFYCAAIGGWMLARHGRKASVLGPVLMFVSLNVTTAFALWDACRGRFRAAWQKT